MAFRQFLGATVKTTSLHNVWYRCIQKRFMEIVTGTENCSTPSSKGLVLGVYADEHEDCENSMLTSVASAFDQSFTNGRIFDLLHIAGPMPKRGECRIFYNLESTFSAIAVCGLGDRNLGYNSHEQIDEGKEAVRIAAATGCKELQKMRTEKIYVESFDDAECAAEGASMALWQFQTFRNLKNRNHVPYLDLYAEQSKDPEGDAEGWEIGIKKAEAQNLTRELMETPSNRMSPTKFAQNVVDKLCDSGVSVEVRVQKWAEARGLTSYLAVAKGSSEPPIFLELSYYGADYDDPPIVLIGQGNTFDSGGICLKELHELSDMKGDVCGAASVVATCRAVASLGLPVNLRGLIPLCEHMIGSNAIKPGDVVTALNGTTVEIKNTDYEGVLVLNDTLTYAQSFNPKFIVDVSTLSDDIDEAFGEACCGIFTNSDELWQYIKNASIHTGDRVWRMPLWNCFADQMRTTTSADIDNVGKGRGGEACKAAAFLREFTQHKHWMHIDAHGIMTTNGFDYPYLRRGMAGRPTRTLIEFVAQAAYGEQ